jgi:hypothetical protein
MELEADFNEIDQTNPYLASCSPGCHIWEGARSSSGIANQVFVFTNEMLIGVDFVFTSKNLI